jgi:ribosomal protein S3
VLLCKRAAFTTPCPCLANQVIVSGKLRAQRAKAMKFKDGYMVSSGNPVHEYIDGAVRHVMLRQGVLGIKVRLVGRLVWLGG